MSTLQYPSPSSLQTSDSFWDVPRLYKDKIYRNKARPITTPGSLATRREGLSEVPPRAPLLNLRTRSGPVVPTVKSLGLSISPTGSVDMSTSRFSLDARSLSGSSTYQPERPTGLAQGLRAKGSRLMRRQNSKFNSRTLEWLDDSDDRIERAPVQDFWSRGTPRHSRVRSAGNSMFELCYKTRCLLLTLFFRLD